MSFLLRRVVGLALTRCWASATASTQTLSRRPLVAVATRSLASPAKPQKVRVVFNTSEGDRFDTWGYEGDSLLDVVVNRNLPLDGYGACEGTVACSTCHVILKEDDYDRLDEPDDEELDMLDLAHDLTDTSRLGCQVILTKDMDGLEVRVPSGFVDARAL